MQLPPLTLVENPAETRNSSAKKQTKKLNQEMLNKIKQSNKHQQKSDNHPKMML